MLFIQQNNVLVPKGLLGSEKSHEFERISDMESLPMIPIKRDYPFNRDLQRLLNGRKLLMDEIPYSLAEIHEHFCNGYVAYNKGVFKEENRYICNRCGNNEQRLFGRFPCSRCKQDCVYCRKCLMMGRVTQCTPLLTWIGPDIRNKYESALKWEGILSPSQNEASEKILTSIEKNEELLVWAVCGAGKTEMLFAGIERALFLGKRIAIATPRTDVVLELAPRFKQAFCDVPVAALYGGSEDRYKYAPLTITTTHQLLRFEHAFDVMIIDEVDAFPYTAEEILQNAANKARKQNSAFIFLTATPKQQWQKECLSGKRNGVILPARYHRHPLPIPSFVWCGDWRKQLRKNRIPACVVSWVKKRLVLGKQVLLFFPHIELMEQALPLFRQFNARIQMVYSEDSQRKEKVLQMRNKEIPILLTTTILERGVTFANIDVAVIGAEDDTFTESALVQISGRVGRSPQYPNGNITFFHYGLTRSMILARNQLLRMNREARQKGLLDE